MELAKERKYLERISNTLSTDYGIELKDLENYIYYGGDYDEHESYYFNTLKQKEQPSHKDYCICKHRIERNCYINTKETPCLDNIIIVGSCCIKKYIPEDQRKRTCEKCGCPHKNRKDNYCNNCRSNFTKCKENIHLPDEEGTRVRELCKKQVDDFLSSFPTLQSRFT